MDQTDVYDVQWRFLDTGKLPKPTSVNIIIIQDIIDMHMLIKERCLQLLDTQK